MTAWYERAAAQIDKDYDDGLIDNAEYQRQMRDLNAELRQEAEDAADQAYNDTMGW